MQNIFFNLLPYFMLIGNFSLFALLMIWESPERRKEEGLDNVD